MHLQDNCAKLSFPKLQTKKTKNHPSGHFSIVINATASGIQSMKKTQILYSAQYSMSTSAKPQVPPVKNRTWLLRGTSPGTSQPNPTSFPVPSSVSSQLLSLWVASEQQPGAAADPVQPHAAHQRRDQRRHPLRQVH